MTRTYENFDVELIASGPTYEAIFHSIPGEPKLAIPFPLEEHELTAFLALFGKHQTRRMESPEFARVRAVGKRLFDTLFTADIRQGLTDATRDAMQQGHGLRVRLDVSQARDLGMVPWEYMYFQEYDDFVSLSNWTPVVRYLDVSQPLPPIPLDGPLRVLVMISDPIERRGTLDVEREWRQLEQALEGPTSRGEIELHRLADGQLETLQIDLQRNQYHVFHFIGHGEYSEEHDDGVLALEDARGREVHVPGNTLGTYLRDSLDTRLVVLNNCEGAAFESDPFTGSAQSLLRKGIPAVVAMQFEITDRAAIDFARGFYTSVGNGFPVDAALAEARKVIRGGPTRVEFGSPVLYMSAETGTLFIRAEEVEIPDDADSTSLTPAVVAGVLETGPESPGPARDEVETTTPGAIEETAPPGAPEKEQEPETTEEMETASRGATQASPGAPQIEQEPQTPDEDGGPAPVGATEEVTLPPLPQEEEAEPPARRIWALAVVALVAIVGLIILANVLTGEDPGVDTTQATAVQTTGAGAETTVAPEAGPLVTWARVPDQQSLGGEGDQIMHDILPTDSGWVAVGTDGSAEGRTAAAWISEDGIDWVRVSSESFPDETSGRTEMRSVVQLADQLVAAGVTVGEDEDAVVWTSRDGTEWARVASGSLGGPGNQAIRALALWESGVVAVGWDGTDGAIWTSSNGMDWVRSGDPHGALLGEGARRIHDVVAGGPGLVAVGETSLSGRDAEIWVSSDGEVWDRVDNDQAGLSAEGDQLTNVVRAGGNGLVAAGYDTAGETGRDAAVWVSSDGFTWTQVGDRDVFGGPNDQEIHALTAVGAGWVAAGWTHTEGGDRNAAIWVSEDGASWSLVDHPQAGLTGAGTQQVESLTTAGTTIIAVGVDGDQGSQEAEVWVGRPD